MTRPFSPLPFALGLLSLTAESLRALPDAWHQMSLRRAWEQTRDRRERNRREAELERGAGGDGPVRAFLAAGDLPDGRVPDSRREVWDGETVRMVGGE